MEKPARSMHLDILGSAAIDANRYRVTIAASEKARQPPQLDFDGLSFDNYLRNPVVMWAHDVMGRSPSGGLPIGRTLSLAKTPGGRIVAEFEFLGDDPFVRRIKNAWDKGFLRAASISWLPLESAPMKGGDWRDARADLLEWSIVSVPADPDALRESHRRMMDEFLGAEADNDSYDAPGGRAAAAGAEEGFSEGIALSSDDYDGLATAVALLREVVASVERSAQSGALPAIEQVVDQGNLAAIRESVAALKRSVQSIPIGAGSPP